MQDMTKQPYRKLSKQLCTYNSRDECPGLTDKQHCSAQCR